MQILMSLDKGVSMKNEAVCRNVKGFTLVELMIALSLFGLLLIYLFSLYGSEFKTQNTIKLRNQSELASSNTLNRVITLIKLQNEVLELTDSSGNLTSRFSLGDGSMLKSLDASTNPVTLTDLVAFVDRNQGHSQDANGQLPYISYSKSASGYSIYDSNGDLLLDHVLTFEISDEVSSVPSYSRFHLFSIRLVTQKGSDHYELDTKVFKINPIAP